ncbi:MAG TPA: DUF6338 family protein [Rhodoplanes sp.]|nr:DUF6338 family protein [Rhodoplanes sp.]
MELVFETRGPNWLRVILWMSLFGFLPALIGLLLGAGSQRGWWRSMISRFGLNVVSPYPTGWDWIFARLKEPAFLLITFDDGAEVAGYFGLASLASSDPSERDLYVEEIYDIGEDGKWTRRQEKQGILISGKIIKHIEVWHAPTSENTDV